MVFGTVKRLLKADDVWSFSPMIDLSIYRWFRRTLRKPACRPADFAAGADHDALQFGTSMLGRFYPEWFFELNSRTWWVELLICAAAPIVVGIPLKIWNAIRLDRKLEEQSRLLLEARFDALQRQIKSAFFVQHAELNRVADPLETGTGARDDREAREHSACAVERPRGIRAAERRA